MGAFAPVNFTRLDDRLGNAKISEGRTRAATDARRNARRWIKKTSPAGPAMEWIDAEAPLGQCLSAIDAPSAAVVRTILPLPCVQAIPVYNQINTKSIDQL
ncbi:MAG: hypothetical protein U5M50_01945 [Sphingobium sp.]|nr:hypothetical protein [Sphingobium sp.]